MPVVWEQKREAQIGGFDVSEYDMECMVANPEDDPLEFELIVWNLDEEAWADVEAGTTAVSIELGWGDGPSNEVVFGAVERTNREYDGNDIMYRMEGEDASEAALASRVSDTYKDMTPDEIVSALASEVGLGVEADEVPQELEMFAVHRSKSLRKWLDELVDYAGQFTGVTWKYFAQGGTLYFIEDNGIDEEIPKLSYDGMLANIAESDDEDSTDERLDFQAALDPRFKQGAQVRVETDQFSGNYEVVSYEYQSSDQTGDHFLSGTLQQLGEAEPYSENVVRETHATGPGNDKIRQY